MYRSARELDIVSKSRSYHNCLRSSRVATLRIARMAGQQVGGKNSKEAGSGRWSKRESSLVSLTPCPHMSAGRKSGPDRRCAISAGQARKRLGRYRVSMVEVLVRSPLDEAARLSERQYVSGGRHGGCSVVCAVRSRSI